MPEADEPTLDQLPRELVRGIGSIGVVGIAIVTMLTLYLGHKGWQYGFEAKQEYATAASTQTGAARVTPGGAAPAVTPPQTTGSTTTTQDPCKTADPASLSFGEAMACLGIAIATGVGAVIKVELIVGLINYIIWTCIVLPIVLLLLAWLLSELGEWLWRNSRQCSKKKRWWQRLWCRIKRILSWVVRIIAILCVIATVISVIYCIISIVALIAVI
jgi:hypothetical protein